MLYLFQKVAHATNEGDDDMTVIIQQVTTKAKIKTISGKLIQDGISHITAVVTDKDGLQAMKRFAKEKYTFQFMN